MNGIDILLLLIIGIFTIVGLFRGFIKQVVRLLSLVVTLWISYHFSSAISKMIGLSGDIAPIITFVIIFIAVAVGLFFVGKLIEGFVKIAMLGWLNKLLGAILAFLEICLISGFVLDVLKYILEKYAENSSTLHAIVTSSVASWLESFANLLLPQMSNMF